MLYMQSFSTVYIQLTLYASIQFFYIFIFQFISHVYSFISFLLMILVFLISLQQGKCSGRYSVLYSYAFVPKICDMVSKEHDMDSMTRFNDKLIFNGKRTKTIPTLIDINVLQLIQDWGKTLDCFSLRINIIKVQLRFQYSE